MMAAAPLTEQEVAPVPMPLIWSAFFSFLASWVCFYLLVSTPLLWGESESFSTFFSSQHFSFYITLGYLLRFVSGFFFAFFVHRFSRVFCFHFFNVVSLIFCFLLLLAPFFPPVWLGLPFLGVIHLAQSFLAGGQSIFLMMLVAEHTPIRCRGLASSVICLPMFVSLLCCFAFSLFCYYFLSFHTTLYVAWPVFVLFPTICIFLSMYFFRSSEHTVMGYQGEDGISAFSRPVQVPLAQWVASIVHVLCLGMGTGVISFMLFYCFIYLSQTVHVVLTVLFILFAVAIFISLPFFLFFGWLSDKIGRLKFVLAALIFAGLSYHGLFSSLLGFAHPQLIEHLAKIPVVLNINPERCPIQHTLSHDQEKPSVCTLFQQFFDRYGITIQHVILPNDKPSFLSIKGDTFFTYDEHLLRMAVQRAGYHLQAPFIEMHVAKLMVTIIIFIIYIAMVSGPSLSYSVEITSKKRRFTHLSFFFYISHSWFCTFLLSYMFYVNPSFQLYTPIVWIAVVVCFLSVAICILFLRDSYDPHNQCLLGQEQKEKTPEVSKDTVRRALSDLRTKDGNHAVLSDRS